jgi:ribose/xylose/arabinose/galactoside ABC-type transport system permease subunit
MTKNLGTIVAKNQRFLPLLSTIALFFIAYALGAVFYDGMREPQVLLNLFRNSPFLLISAVGSTLVIISGGIDLSVSGMVALTTVASAALLREGWNAWGVMLLMLAMGMALGAIMGFFITYLKVQPFIATLAGMWFARGMCFFISDDAIAINNRIYTIIARTKILIPGLADPITKQGPYISILVVIELLVLIVAMYVAHYTRFGRTVYSMGGNAGANEQSARLMGLPVDSTKMLVYTLNGFCSALAGITLSMTVMSGHGLYAPGFEMTVIAAVVIGGTMLTGGEGYVFGTLFGVLVTAVIQTLIQFNGKLSSWWTSIAVGGLTLIFIGVQSLLAARKTRELGGEKTRQAEEGRPLREAGIQGLLRSRQVLWIGGAILVIVVGVFAFNSIKKATSGATSGVSTPASAACQLQPYRRDQADGLLQDGAVIVYERNGGSGCIDEIYAIYPDGRIVGDNGEEIIEETVSPADVEQLLSDIADKGWFTDEMYNTWHTPCGQCYGYYLTVSYGDQEKTVKAVDGGTDAPADYWQVVSRINGIIPEFNSTP